MEDLLLLDAIERYFNNELNASELEHFEHLRATNNEIDQLVVEQSFYLKQIKNYGERKNFKLNLDTIHNELVVNKEIEIIEKKGLVIRIFEKYKKEIAIAASAAVLLSFGSMVAYNKSNNNIDFVKLSNKVDAVDKKINTVTAEINKTKPIGLKPSIVATTTGTSFIINEKGYLLTNYHVVSNTKNVYVYNEKYGDLTAEVILKDSENDLAIIKITDTLFSPTNKLPYHIKNDDAMLGQKIYTLGYSRPPAITYNEGFVSSKAVNANLTNKQNFLLTLQVEGGNSGSPIFINNGEIVGIISAKEKIENGYAVGVKPESIKNIIAVLNNDINNKNNIFGRNTSANLNREQQIKREQDFIYMVKIK